MSSARVAACCPDLTTGVGASRLLVSDRSSVGEWREGRLTDLPAGKGGAPPASRTNRAAVTLPPGQYRVDGFPRFGTHLHRPPPRVPVDPAIEICGAVAEPFAVPL